MALRGKKQKFIIASLLVVGLVLSTFVPALLFATKSTFAIPTKTALVKKHGPSVAAKLHVNTEIKDVSFNPHKDYNYEANLGDYALKFNDKSGKKVGFRFEYEDSYLGFNLRGAKGLASAINKNKLIFNLARDMSVKYTVHEDKVKEEIILKGKPATNIISFDFIQGGLTYIKRDDGYHFFDQSGDELFWVLNPTIEDANGVSGTISMDISGSTCIFTIDQAFLDNAAYPVTIDPTVVTSTSGFAVTRFPINRKLLKTSAGTLVLFYQSGSGIVYRTSTDNGATWSTPTTVTSGTYIQFSVYIDSSNNMYLTYCYNGTNTYIFFKKLTYSGSNTWTTGTEYTVEGANTNPRYPTIVRESGGRIWVPYRYYDGTSYYIYIKYSDNDGVNWSAATNLSDTHSAGSSTLVLYNGYPAIIYENTSTSLAWRYWNGSTWSTAATIVSGVNVEDYSFSATITDNSYVHLVYGNGSTFIRHTYYSGTSWSTPTDITIASGDSRPSLITDGTNLWCFWSQYVGLNQYKVVYKKYNGTSWDANPTIFTPSSERIFDKVWTYIGVTWTDETTDAGNTTAADVPLFTNKNDVLYVGLSEKFDYIYFDLSTLASATVTPTWQYWNGSAWVTLTLSENPTYGFTADGAVRFTALADWTTTSVNGSASLYFVKITRTATTVATTPVATQFTPVKYNTYCTTILKDNAIVAVAWGEGVSSYYVLFDCIILPNITLTIDETYDIGSTTPNGTNSVNFGTTGPENSPYVVNVGSGNYAIKLTVTSNVNWDYTVQASQDLKGGAKTIPISQLKWDTDPGSTWTSFTTSTYTISSGNPPNSPTGTSYRYDYQLNITWNDDPGTYSTTITYTALQSP